MPARIENRYRLSDETNRWLNSRGDAWYHGDVNKGFWVVQSPAIDHLLQDSFLVSKSGCVICDGVTGLRGGSDLDSYNRSIFDGPIKPEFKFDEVICTADILGRLKEGRLSPGEIASRAAAKAFYDIALTAQDLRPELIEDFKTYIPTLLEIKNFEYLSTAVRSIPHEIFVPNHPDNHSVVFTTNLAGFIRLNDELVFIVIGDPTIKVQKILGGEVIMKGYAQGNASDSIGLAVKLPYDAEQAFGQFKAVKPKVVIIPISDIARIEMYTDGNNNDIARGYDDVTIVCIEDPVKFFAE